MRYSAVIDRLQNLINYIPSQAQLCEITGIKTSTMSNRAARNSEFSDEEITAIEKYYDVDITTQKSETVTLDYYPEVFGSCGTGYFVPSEQKKQIQVPVNNFIKHFSTGKKYSVINAKGDSMEPFIYSGDKLVVEHYNGEQIVDNQVYVFCYENELFVKRLTKNINQLVIKSDNTMYDIIKLVGEELNKVIIVGQIVGLMRDMR